MSIEIAFEDDESHSLNSTLSVIPGLPGRIQSSADFVAAFQAPDYVLDGIIQRGFLYSNTAKTGAGKTAISLRLLAHVALGEALAGREVLKGRTLMLVGENPDDVRARWIALSEHMQFDATTISADFLPYVDSMRNILPEAAEQAKAVGGYTLVVVDTSAAYFQGDDENANVQLGDHARALRKLTTLSGHPAVIANCHPPKNAVETDLLPRGGGAFIAEVDGNLTTVKRETVELHWQGKFRGPEFDPIAFELMAATSDVIRDGRGRLMPTIIARPLSDLDQQLRDELANDDARKLLAVMNANPNASIAKLAERAGWIAANGSPHKSKISRLLKKLKEHRLTDKVLDTWMLTNAGEKIAKAGVER